MRRTIFTAVLILASLAISPVRPVEAASCYVTKKVYTLQTVCFGTGTRTRAVARCSNGATRYGSYVYDGFYSTANCSPATVVGGYAHYIG